MTLTDREKLALVKKDYQEGFKDGNDSEKSKRKDHCKTGEDSTIPEELRESLQQAYKIGHGDALLRSSEMIKEKNLYILFLETLLGNEKTELAKKEIENLYGIKT